MHSSFILALQTITTFLYFHRLGISFPVLFVGFVIWPANCQMIFHKHVFDCYYWKFHYIAPLATGSYYQKDFSLTLFLFKEFLCLLTSSQFIGRFHITLSCLQNNIMICSYWRVFHCTFMHYGHQKVLVYDINETFLNPICSSILAKGFIWHKYLCQLSGHSKEKMVVKMFSLFISSSNHFLEAMAWVQLVLKSNSQRKQQQGNWIFAGIILKLYWNQIQYSK